MNRTSSVVAAVAAVVVSAAWFAGPAHAQSLPLSPAANLLSDVVGNSEVMPDITVVGSVAYVVRSDGGLMRTDGTPQGTTVISTISPKIIPGPRTKLVGFRDRIFWLGDDKTLWVSEGSGAGTYRFWRAETVTPTPPFVLGDSLYFFADGKLFRSEGTIASTQMVTTRFALSEALVQGGLAYFTCLDGDGMAALCVTNGTALGTTVISTLPDAFSLTLQVHGVVGGNVLVNGTDSGLWSVNLASGIGVTLPVSRVGSTTRLGPATPPPPVVLDGFAYFPCVATEGSELCRTDGTIQGTSVLDLYAGSSGSSPQVARLGAQLLVHAERGTTGHDLYTSDGTLTGTTLLSDLPARPGGLPSTTRLVTIGDLVYFASPDMFGTLKLARTDGTPAGTLLLDVNVSGSPFDLAFENVASLGGKLLFPGGSNDGTPFPNIWISDGTRDGTRPAAKLVPSAFSSANIRAYVVGDGMCAHGRSALVRFGAVEGTASLITVFSNGKVAATPTLLYYAEGDSLYGIDCAARDRFLVKDLGHRIEQVVALGERLVVRSKAQDQDRVSFSDGTASGTVESDLANVSFLASANGSIWMMQNGTLLRSDGTRNGTAVVSELQNTAVVTHAIVPFGSYVALVVTVDETRMELWRSDGTASGTIRLKQLSSFDETPPVAVYAWNDVLYFGASAFDRGELWRTDGTFAGTSLVKDITPAGSMVAWGNQLFVSAAGPGGVELWRTDGTAAGTVEVADLFAGPLGSAPRDLFVQAPAGPLMFSAATPEVGRELWILEDPAGKPVLIRDMAPGPESSGLMAFHQSGDTVFYYAYLDGRGTLWRTPVPNAPVPLPEKDETGCGCAAGAPWPGGLAPAAIVALGLLLRRRRQTTTKRGLQAQA